MLVRSTNGPLIHVVWPVFQAVDPKRQIGKKVWPAMRRYRAAARAMLLCNKNRNRLSSNVISFNDGQGLRNFAAMVWNIASR